MNGIAPKKKKIAPSILSADFTRLGEEIAHVSEAGADLIHVDVMDGHFVPNLTIGPPIIEAIRKITDLPIDVHVMITNPDETFQDYVSAGADYLTIHVEASTHLHRTVQAIREKGAKAGVTLNPATPLSSVEDILPDIDLLLIMSVNPGFGGQSFIPSSMEKIRRARKMIDERGLRVELEIDGGIKMENIAEIAEAGADIFVSGSGIFKSPDYKETIQKMRSAVGG